MALWRKMAAVADEPKQWNPACWEWPIPDLSHLHDAEPLDVEDEAWDTELRIGMQEGAAMCGEHFGRDLKTDHDHSTGYIRGLLCHSCNRLEASHNGAATPLGRYRDKNPASMLGLNIRYVNPFTGLIAEPEPEPDMQKMREIVFRVRINDSDSDSDDAES